MVLGMPLPVFTLVHVVLSLIGIAAGFVAVGGFMRSRRTPAPTLVFLVTTIMTSVTGFLFPFEKLLPSHIFGAISLPVLAAAVAGLYFYRLAGAWRWIFVSASVFAQYLNVFVLVVQLFLKVPFLKGLAPTQSEPPFLIAQVVVLIVFGVLGVKSVRSFRPAVLVTA